MLYDLARTVLFTADPETAHELSMDGLRIAHHLGATRLLCQKSRLQPVHCMGLEFPNPVGVAPGLDKNADYFEALGDLGFGFVEVGTVTPRPRVIKPTIGSGGTGLQQCAIWVSTSPTPCTMTFPPRDSGFSGA